MQDRVSETPGRMLITPENGQPAFYATIEMADNPSVLGTPLNKASLLTDATAALFGLGADAVPDDVFQNLPVVYRQYVTTITVPSGGYAYYEFSPDDAGKTFILRPSKTNNSRSGSFYVYPVGTNNQGEIVRGGSGFTLAADGTISSQKFSSIVKTPNSEAKIIPLIRNPRSSVPAGSGVLILESLYAKFLSYPRTAPTVFGCSFLQEGDNNILSANMIAIGENVGATYDLYVELGYKEV